jgi:hypothetical protein
MITFKCAMTCSSTMATWGKFVTRDTTLFET